ncbi:MAG: efflux RND transporter periplasmic adaptor subunit [Bosea sp. (in: a-proteobacteria)]
MRSKVVITGLAAIGLGLAGYWFVKPAGGAADVTPYRTAAVDRGAIIATVRATGTLNPVSTVLVGSQLSGQIVEILADYNAQVKAGQIVARLNSDQIKARRDAAAADVAQARSDQAVRKAQAERSRATRLRAESTVRDLVAQRERVVAQRADADRSFVRQKELFARGVGSQVALDNARTQGEVQAAALNSAEAQIASAKAEIVGLDADIALADAQVKTAEAMILQRQAKLTDTEIDLERTDIRSPVDGVVVQRQVELGQTVAASLSTPTLFLIAQDLSSIEIYANIDESDVGRLKPGQIATFTVAAYPERTFQGRLKLVRLGATTIQNVVTYTAVITVSNADMALLPGMTANLQLVTEERRDVLRISNAALRFRPPAGVGVQLPEARRPPALVEGTEEGGAAGRGGQGGGQGGGQAAAAAFRERLMAEVKPTPEQAKVIDAILAEGRESARAARSGLSPEERRALNQQQRRENGAKIAQALDPERRKLFEAMVAEARVARGGGGVPGRIHVLDAKGEPKAISVRTGVSDGALTEIVSGDVAEAAKVIVGGGPKSAPAAASGPASRGPRLF